jgi:hypothetical protein
VASDSAGHRLPAGPVSSFVSSLLANEQVVGVLGGKVGYWVVRAPSAIRWMTAHGQRVAQAVGEAGRAGGRAQIVGGTTLALTPAGAAALSAAIAHQVLVSEIRKVGALVSLVHQRQVSEVLGVADRGIALVNQLMSGFEGPADWPEALVYELVRLHGLVADQGAASDRLRDRCSPGPSPEIVALRTQASRHGRSPSSKPAIACTSWPRVSRQRGRFTQIPAATR